jgi:putative nucleotidyltransferase with HDIG domain
LKQINIGELLNNKILPFNLFNEDGDIIMKKGEPLTSGRILQLKYVSALYKDDEVQEEIEPPIVEQVSVELPPKKEKEEIKFDELYFLPEIEIQSLTPELMEYIKQNYSKAMSTAVNEEIKNNSSVFYELRNKIVQGTINNLKNLVYKSQFLVEGDYHEVHGINTAILATALASSLRMTRRQINNIALAALLHDVGKRRLPKEILDKKAPTGKEEMALKQHPMFSYKIIRNELLYPEEVGQIVLNHHERSDGSGYPSALESNEIKDETYVLIVADVFHNIISGRTEYAASSPKQATKIMLEIGSKWFMPNILYAFVYMNNNDGDFTGSR